MSTSTGTATKDSIGRRLIDALYPFGGGLSYTTFEYSDLNIEPATLTANQPVTERATKSCNFILTISSVP